VRYPLWIHWQGAVHPRALRRLKAHFPNAGIVLPEEADRVVQPWLEHRKLLRLLAMRRANGMMLKLIDFKLFGHSPNVLSLDSDILFFRYPTELVVATSEPLPKAYFQHDLDSAYNIRVSAAWDDLRVRLEPRLCAGLRLFARETLDLERCEFFLAHPAVAKNTGLIEQTLHALCASEKGIVALLPDAYLVSLEPRVEIEQLIARHYPHISRPQFTEEGIRYLIQMGFLDRLRRQEQQS
jgi:hypothetical protein